MEILDLYTRDRIKTGKTNEISTCSNARDSKG